MTVLRVAVATTEGPAEVQALAPEDAPDVKSVICVDGGSDALPVSRAYDGFVRRPTGVIEARFGHRVWRMDVSAPIGDGDSWQLGAYAAHMLHAHGRLATDGTAEPWAAYVLATGAVDTRLKVRGVDHVRTKLEMAAPRLYALLRQGIPVYLAVPEDNAGDLAASVFRDLGLAGVDVFQCRTADALDVRLPALAEEGQATVPGQGPSALANDAWDTHMNEAETDGRRGRRSGPTDGKSGAGFAKKLGAAAGIVVLLLAAGLWLLRDVPSLVAAAREGNYAELARRLDNGDGGLCLACTVVGGWIRGHQPATADVGATAVELSAEGIRSCTASTFGDGSYARKRLTPGSQLPRTDPGTICALEYQALNRSNGPIPMAIALHADNAEVARKTERSVAPGQSMRLRLEASELSNFRDGVAVVVLAGGLGTGDLAEAVRARPGLLRPDGGDAGALGVQRKVIRHPFAQTDTEPKFQ